MDTTVFCYINLGGKKERTVTPGTAAKGSGGDGCVRVQHGHRQPVPSGHEANPPVPCHLALLSQYRVKHGKDLDTMETGGVSSSCPFFTFILSSEPWLYGWDG